jgi:hypothetical protein
MITNYRYIKKLTRNFPLAGTLTERPFDAGPKPTEPTPINLLPQLQPTSKHFRFYAEKEFYTRGAVN